MLRTHWFNLKSRDENKFPYRTTAVHVIVMIRMGTGLTLTKRHCNIKTVLQQGRNPLNIVV